MREQNLVEILRSYDIQTRVVECFLAIEFTELTQYPFKRESLDSSLESRKLTKQERDKELAFLQEYEMLGESANDVVSQALYAHSRERDTNNALVLELLIQMYKKITKIEQFLLKDSRILLPLQQQGGIVALGHGVICCGEEYFVSDRIYYARFCLPNVSWRTISVFARAITNTILRITHIHSHDNSALDGYIVSKEMEQLRQKRIGND